MGPFKKRRSPVTYPTISLLEVLSEISDFRRANQIKYSVEQILGLVFIALIAGVKHILHIEHFGKAHSGWFKEVLGLENPPSDTTIARVVQSVSFSDLETALMLWTEQIFDNKKVRTRIVIDSKKVTDGVTLTRALMLGVNQVIGCSKYNQYESEIVNIPKVIKKLNKHGYLISIDAIGTQTKIANQILSANCDFLLPVKGNQKSLLEDLRLYIESEKCAAETHETVEKNRGRNEKRKTYVFNDVDWLSKRHPHWKGIKSFALLESYRRVNSSSESCNSRIYISSKIMDAREFLHEIRSHWHIENMLHWVLNQSFEENKTHIKTFSSIINMSTIMTSVLTLLFHFKEPGASFNLQKMKLNWDLTHVEKILCLKAQP